ncbi:hypothetical protein [Alloalcanivorax gelatiniphagus]|uniref:DUF4145 domain-containing protein n=1 Tax=Alloalcanivorax gelatiniphagus TaxID=1194167 RepID=A0ABY2XR33_9GAMM|nr:hypothetical protein [Alloalcanivorax gelatiniphagus]TMW14592.1 hypothetical protein FGS76_02030 [Alloalcanivorax gelatiniphagus]
MEILEFILGVIEATAWPAVVLVAVFFLRKHLASILLTLTKLRYKDLELDFGRELRELGQQAEEAHLVTEKKRESRGGPKEPTELLDEAEQLAEEFPEPAVAVAWSAVESALIEAAESHADSDQHREFSPSRNIKFLADRNILDRRTLEVLHGMQRLRNVAIHERWNAFGGVSTREAYDFIRLARGICGKLIPNQ